MCKKKPRPGEENYYHPDTARGLAKITAIATCFISFTQILAYIVITGFYDHISLVDESILIAAACAIIIGVTLICAIGAKSICLCLPYMFLVPCLTFFYVFKGVLGIYNFIELLETNTNPLPSPLPPGPRGPDDIDYDTDPPGRFNQSDQVAVVGKDVEIIAEMTSLQDITADTPRPMNKTQGIILLVAILNLILAIVYIWFVLNVARLMGRMNDEAEKAKESQKEKKEAEAVEHERERAEAREVEREEAYEAAHEEELISLKNSNSGGPAGTFKYFPLGSENGEFGQEGHSGPSRYLAHSGGGSGGPEGRYLEHDRYLGHHDGHHDRYLGHHDGHHDRYLGGHHDRYLGHHDGHHKGHHDRYLGHHEGHHDGHHDRYLGHHNEHGNRYLGHDNRYLGHGHHNEHHDHTNPNHHNQHHH